MDTDILISGAGVPGLALALILGRAGLRVCVIERNAPPAPDAPPKAEDGRTTALMDGPLQVLKRTGVWDDLRAHGETLDILRIIDDNLAGQGAKPTQVDFHARDIGLPAFGINFPNRNVVRALLGAARDMPNITLLAPATLQSYRAGAAGVEAVLEDGRVMRARLLVGADGRESAVRTLAGIDVDRQDYGQSAITCLIAHSKAHDNISTEFHRPGGPFTIVPLQGKRSSIVWVEKTDDAERFMAIRKDAFEQALQDRTAGMVGKITLETTPVCWALSGLRARRLTAPRVALIAEAAHVLHPLGAQGLNLSLRDVGALADHVLEAARLGLDIGSKVVLDGFESARRADIWTRKQGTDGLNRLVSNDIGLLHNMRATCLKTMGRVGPLKRAAMRFGVANRE